ncbi:ICP22 family protein [Pyrococcus kukulkanii]|uniref:Uncharacterized protein n=1 Tax=Pyrococcus kukulkanii TaxID=1609559 RepID=A0A127BA15_9EURY|nr:hypothetical protein [Pyrococcus kukulkanii]AMM54180.1 hypothetical protein TQ32_06595 [Pyrococcus kukulkanii]
MVFSSAQIKLAARALKDLAGKHEFVIVVPGDRPGLQVMREHSEEEVEEIIKQALRQAQDPSKIFVFHDDEIGWEKVNLVELIGGAGSIYDVSGDMRQSENEAEAKPEVEAGVKTVPGAGPGGEPEVEDVELEKSLGPDAGEVSEEEIKVEGEIGVVSEVGEVPGAGEVEGETSESGENGGSEVKSEGEMVIELGKTKLTRTHVDYAEYDVSSYVVSLLALVVHRVANAKQVVYVEDIAATISYILSVEYGIEDDALIRFYIKKVLERLRDFGWGVAEPQTTGDVDEDIVKEFKVLAREWGKTLTEAVKVLSRRPFEFLLADQIFRPGRTDIKREGNMLVVSEKFIQDIETATGLKLDPDEFSIVLKYKLTTAQGDEMTLYEAVAELRKALIQYRIYEGVPPETVALSKLMTYGGPWLRKALKVLEAKKLLRVSKGKARFTEELVEMLDLPQQVSLFDNLEQVVEKKAASKASLADLAREEDEEGGEEQ